MGCNVSSSSQRQKAYADTVDEREKVRIPPRTLLTVSKSVTERAAIFDKKDARAWVGDFVEYKKGLYAGTMSDEKLHGYGIYIMPNGDQYEGEYLKGEMHGWGRYQYGNGDSYEGTWKHGSNSGIGVYTFATSGVYKGFFKKGHMSGFGTFFLPDGSEHIGSWESGQRSGHGCYTSPDKTYEGDWKLGKEHGIGISLTPDTLYYGSWSSGHKDGKGIMEVTSPLHITKYLCCYEMGYRKSMIAVDSDEAGELLCESEWKSLLLKSDAALSEATREPSKKLREQQKATDDQFTEDDSFAKERVLMTLVKRKKQQIDNMEMETSCHTRDAYTEDLKSQITDIIDINERLKRRNDELKREIEGLHHLSEENDLLNRKIIALKQQLEGTSNYSDSTASSSGVSSTVSYSSNRSSRSSHTSRSSKIRLHSARVSRSSLLEITPGTNHGKRKPVKVAMVSPFKASAKILPAVRNTRQQEDEVSARITENLLCLDILESPNQLLLTDDQTTSLTPILQGCSSPAVSSALELRNRFELAQTHVKYFSASLEEKAEFEKLDELRRTAVARTKTRLNKNLSSRVSAIKHLEGQVVESLEQERLKEVTATQQLMKQIKDEIRELTAAEARSDSSLSISQTSMPTRNDMVGDQVDDLEAQLFELENAFAEDRAMFRRAKNELRDLKGLVRVSIIVDKSIEATWTNEGDMAVEMCGKLVTADGIMVKDIDGMEDYSTFVAYVQEGYSVSILVIGLESATGVPDAPTCLLSSLRNLLSAVFNEVSCWLTVTETVSNDNEIRTLQSKIKLIDYNHLSELLCSSASCRESHRSPLFTTIDYECCATGDKMFHSGSLTICEIPVVSPEIERFIKHDEPVRNTGLKNVLGNALRGKHKTYAIVNLCMDDAAAHVELVPYLRSIQNDPVKAACTEETKWIKERINRTNEGF
eukprot:TRINITY_DN9863_c0_g1_i1.p1 TRINITY_DN9863_c0_g1~~TRINITY_DN9863_c0_g1_i1.p1  ORF type:complete len:932 (+),score=120.73 TRINITY_DN9863_c0_g1_i1:52-2847(+)